MVERKAETILRKECVNGHAFAAEHQGEDCPECGARIKMVLRDEDTGEERLVP